MAGVGVTDRIARCLISSLLTMLAGDAVRAWTEHTATPHTTTTTEERDQ